MKQVLLMLICIIFIGCEKKEMIERSLVCDDYKIDIYKQNNTEEMNIKLNDEKVNLKIAVSASGAKYSGVLKDNTRIDLWGKGNNWTLFLNDDKSFDCK